MKTIRFNPHVKVHQTWTHGSSVVVELRPSCRWSVLVVLVVLCVLCCSIICEAVMTALFGRVPLTQARAFLSLAPPPSLCWSVFLSFLLTVPPDAAVLIWTCVHVFPNIPYHIHIYIMYMCIYVCMWDTEQRDKLLSSCHDTWVLIIYTFISNTDHSGGLRKVNKNNVHSESPCCTTEI